ncbi:TetR family transcriptional regulator [Marinobacter salinexigens]|uniref:TetR family transcriptional regulator n=1 Tax=Marinobacter salinexigens TaxID=2919747 RepID=A0A5B0VFI2_9GAMM|nr:TetR family transcriptional regulator [Marinobacter salinexigens]KAA1172779.1 TetR family transcriptional regulator [Marinobacter salinexigens]
MARRTKEDAQKTRELLIEAAENVFFEKGVSKASLNDIAVAAGVTRGAIYWHFKNKHDVFEAMIERLKTPLEMLHDAIEHPDEPDPLGRFRELIIYLTQQISRDPRRRRVYEIMFLKCELTEQNEPLGSKHRQAFLDGTVRIRKALESALKRGQLPADINIEQAIVQLHVQLTGLIYMWLLLPGSFDFEREAEHIIDTYFYALQHCFGADGLTCGG